MCMKRTNYCSPRGRKILPATTPRQCLHILPLDSVGADPSLHWSLEPAHGRQWWVFEGWMAVKKRSLTCISAVCVCVSLDFMSLPGSVTLQRIVSNTAVQYSQEDVNQSVEGVVKRKSRILCRAQNRETVRSSPSRWSLGVFGFFFANEFKTLQRSDLNKKKHIPNFWSSMSATTTSHTAQTFLRQLQRRILQKTT